MMSAVKKPSRISWDLLISSLFILMGASGCYAFVHYRDQLDQLISGVPVGELHPSNPTGVRLRANNSMIWQDVGNIQSVSMGDAVFTGHAATTKVVLKNRIETEISSDSLVVFNAPSDEMKAKFPNSFAVLSVELGSVKLNVASHDGETLLIQAGGKLFSLPTKVGAIDLHIDKNTGMLEAKSEQGEIVALKEEPVTLANVSEPESDIPVERLDDAKPKPEEVSLTHPLVTSLQESVVSIPKAKQVLPPKITPIETFTRTPASEPQVSLDTDLFTPKVAYGVSFVSFSQRGFLGKGSGGAVSASLLKAGLEFQSGDFGACFEFSRYSLDFEAVSSSGASTSSKAFQNMGVQGAYKNFHAGIQAKTAPLLVVASATDVRFLDYTTLSIIAGYQIKKDWVSSSGKALQSSLDFTAELPLSGSSSSLDGTVVLNHGSGYGAKVTGKLDKALSTVKPDSMVQFTVGLEASGAFTRNEVNASISNVSGDSTRDLQEYQAILQLKMNF